MVERWAGRVPAPTSPLALLTGLAGYTSFHLVGWRYLAARRAYVMRPYLNKFTLHMSSTFLSNLKTTLRSWGRKLNLDSGHVLQPVAHFWLSDALYLPDLSKSSEFLNTSRILHFSKHYARNIGKLKHCFSRVMDSSRYGI